MSDCRHIETLLVDHALAELDPLKSAYVMAHLSRCTRCARAADRLGEALVSARGFEVELSEDDLDRLTANLGPYLSSRPPWALVSALAAAALVAGLWAMWPASPAAMPSPSMVAAIPPTLKATAPEPPPPSVQRSRPREGLAVVSSGDWDGTVATLTPKRFELTMSRGFAVIDFDGQGRTLVVRAPDVAVDVVGTRFFVEARTGIPTTVGVIAGKVRVHDRRGATPIGAGASLSFGPDGPAPAADGPSAAHHQDPYFQPHRAPAKATASVSSPPPTPAPTILDELLEAEGLAREGDHEGALLLYERLLAKGPSARQRAMARFERARLWVKLGRRDAALGELDELRQGPGEIGRQSAILACELEGGCAAKRCLESLGDRLSSSEIDRLLARTSCP